MHVIVGEPSQQEHWTERKQFRTFLRWMSLLSCISIFFFFLFFIFTRSIGRQSAIELWVCYCARTFPVMVSFNHNIMLLIELCKLSAEFRVHSSEAPPFHRSDQGSILAYNYGSPDRRKLGWVWVGAWVFIWEQTNIIEPFNHSSHSFF